MTGAKLKRMEIDKILMKKGFILNFKKKKFQLSSRVQFFFGKIILWISIFPCYLNEDLLEKCISRQMRSHKKFSDMTLRMSRMRVYSQNLL